MSTSLRGGLVLGVILFLLAPPAATTNSRGPAETWPHLLSHEAASDPIVAQLHQRANAALEMLRQAEQSSQWRLQLAESRSDGGMIITEH